jgi:hypothetical protein
MITLTLEEGKEFEKTHFKNIEELLSYLDLKATSLLPHETQEFFDELDKRIEAYKKEPKSARPFREVLSGIKPKG